MAFGMVAFAGMSDQLPNLSFYNNNEYSFQRPYSETTAKQIDEEVQKMINEQYERAKQILTEHKDGHAQLAQLLVEREVIFADDVEKIFGKRPWTSRSEELLEAQQRAEAEAMAKRRAEELGLPFEPDAKTTDSEDTKETPEAKNTENTETK
jgi:cell division protease FtsH